MTSVAWTISGPMQFGRIVLNIRRSGTRTGDLCSHHIFTVLSAMTAARVSRTKCG